MAKLPFEGMRVVTFEIMWAASMASQTLGDLGAEVIRVENIYKFSPGTTSRGGWPKQTKEQNASVPPQRGAYPNREPGDKPYNQNPWHFHNLRNKHSMTLNIRRPEGWAIFEKLIKVTDIVIENNVTETADRLGLTYEKLSQIKPDIILIRMPAYGLTGPYANRRSWGVHIEDFIGHNLLRAYRDMGPTGNSMVFASDYVAGAMGVFAAMLALRHKRKTGKGQMVELAQAEAAMMCLGETIMDYSMNQRVAQSIGNRDIHGGAPYGTYRCKGEDRWVNISVTNDDEWRGFCQALGNPRWTKRERFDNAPSRYRNQDELDKHVEEWTINHNHYEIMYLLQAHGVPAGPVMDARDFFNDPHWKERDWFEKMNHAQVGTRLMPGVFAKFAKTPIHIRKSPVMLGEDNEYVYKELLKISDEEYENLKRKAHIGTEYIDELPT